jgi:hypothetical protein
MRYTSYTPQTHAHVQAWMSARAFATFGRLFFSVGCETQTGARVQRTLRIDVGWLEGGQNSSSPPQCDHETRSSTKHATNRRSCARRAILSCIRSACTGWEPTHLNHPTSMRNVRGTLTRVCVSHPTLENDLPKVAKAVHRDLLCTYARVQDVYDMKRIEGCRLREELASPVNHSANDGVVRPCNRRRGSFVLRFCQLLD